MDTQAKNLPVALIQQADNAQKRPLPESEAKQQTVASVICSLLCGYSGKVPSLQLSVVATLASVVLPRGGGWGAGFDSILLTAVSCREPASSSEGYSPPMTMGAENVELFRCAAWSGV